MALNMLAALAGAALAALVLLARTGTETGARNWQRELEKTNRRAGRRAAKILRGKAPISPRPRRASSDCCDAPSDNWKASREVYDRWLPGAPMSFREAYQLCFNESVEAAAAGDYSKPADRRCGLGKLHANKLAQWNDCREGCRDPFAGSRAAGRESIERFTADDGTGAIVWAGADGGAVRVVPLGALGWRVDPGTRAGWREGSYYDDEEEAHEAARDLLDVPF